MKLPNDLQKDWPPDPHNDELLQFAQQVKDSLPVFAPEALARVQGKIETALDRDERRQGWRRVVLGGSVAAAILLALVSYSMLRIGPIEKVRDRPPALVQDQVSVAFSESTPLPEAGRPLVPLDDYRSLFAD